MSQQVKVVGPDAEAQTTAPAKGASIPKNLQLLRSLIERKPSGEIAEATNRFTSEAPTTTPEPISIDLVATENPTVRRLASRWKLRHLITAASFILCVIVPTTLASLYMAFVAADQYRSTSSFSIRSIESGPSSDLLGMFAQAGSGGSTLSDSYVLLDFIMSDRMVKAVDKMYNLDNVFAPRGADYYYGIGGGLPIEAKVAYWRDMVSVNFDHASGIMNLNVNAFNPEDSQRISAFIIQQSEKLINDLSLTGRNEMLKVAQSEVSTSEIRLSDARDALRNYRDVSQEADPVEGAKLATQLVASLEQQMVRLQTELSTALTQMGEDTPRIRVMRSQIDALKKQIDQEKQRFGSGVAPKQSRNASDVTVGVAGRLQQYEKLETQREFAERAYTSSLAALEKARIEANAKQRYLAVFINPTLSELAQYPNRMFNSLLVLLGTLLIWSVAVMGYYNIRDRN